MNEEHEQMLNDLRKKIKAEGSESGQAALLLLDSGFFESLQSFVKEARKHNINGQLMINTIISGATNFVMQCASKDPISQAIVGAHAITIMEEEIALFINRDKGE